MSLRKSSYSLLVLVLVVLIAVDMIHGQNSCTTPNLTTGVCVPMLSCKTIRQSDKTDSTPLAILLSEGVRQALCGTFDNVQYVCCEAKHISNGTAIKDTIGEQQTILSITDRTLEVDFEGGNTGPSSEETPEQIQFGMNILEKTNCGDAKYVRISHGKDADLSAYPWMALLVYSDGVKKTFNCGGTLITDRYVLTAAHCLRVRSEIKKLVSVRLGEHDTKETIDCTGEGSQRRCAPPIQEIDIEKAIYHKNYQPSIFSNDIGLIRLMSKAIFCSNVQPICLPTTSSLAVTLDLMTIAGWGKLETGAPATILQEGGVLYRQNDYCNKALNLQLTENHLCAGGGDSKVSTCLGDSGGPIFCFVPHGKESKFVQYGIASIGSWECGLEFPTVFTRVAKYLSWIAGNFRL